MKRIVLIVSILTLLTISLFSQSAANTIDNKSLQTIESPDSLNCSGLLTTETDEKTGESTTVSKNMLIISDDGGMTGFGVLLAKRDYTIILSIQTAGADECIDVNDKMNVLFRDGTKIELKNEGEYNCSGVFTLYFGDMYGKGKKFKMFTTKEIKTMSIWTSQKYVEKDFTSEQSKKLMKTFNCLLDN